MFKARLLDIISYISPNGTFSTWNGIYEAFQEGMEMMKKESISEMDLDINNLILRYIPGSHFTVSNGNVFFMLGIPDSDQTKQDQLDYTRVILEKLAEVGPEWNLVEFGKQLFGHDDLPSNFVLRIIQDVYELSNGVVFCKALRYVKDTGIWIPYEIKLKGIVEGEVELGLLTPLRSTDPDWINLNTKSKLFPVGSVEIAAVPESVLEEG